jgi:hypothetical protein
MSWVLLTKRCDTVRQQIGLTKPLYEKRAKTVAQIPNFWSLVFEQAPQEVDQYIQPTDSAVLLSSLKSLSVSHFELDEDPAKGEPRSISIRFEFEENEYFEDAVLEKKFWQRQAKEGWAGLVSEPVAIKWKPGKDLTDGMLDLVGKVWAAQKASGELEGEDSKPKKPADYTADEKALKDKIEQTGLGGMSFFAFFGYRGFHISPEESRAAVAKADEERKLRAEGKAPKKSEEEEEDDDEDDEDDDEDPLDLEIFPDGDEVAVAIAEDLWPSAIKYFSKFFPLPNSPCRGFTYSFLLFPLSSCPPSSF